MKRVVSKIVSNSMFLMISSLSATAFSFFYWLAIGKLLLPQDYGIISTTINFSVFLSVISVFGFNFALIKLLPEYLSKGQNKKIDSLMSFSFKFMFFSGLLATLLLLIFSKVLASTLNLPQNAIFIASAFMFFITIATYFDSVLRGFQNMKWVAIMQTSGQFIKLSLSIILIFLGFKYAGPLLGFLALHIVMSLIGLKFVPVKAGRSNLDYRELLKRYSLPAFISTILSYIFYSGRFVILNAIKSSSATGIFSLATTMTAPLILLPSVLLQAIFPISSELTAKSKYQVTINKTISYFLRYTLLITLPLAVFLAMFSKPIILTFSRPEYLASTSLFPILAVSSIIFSLGGIFYQTLYALGKTKVYRNIMIASTTIFLLTSIPLTYKFSELGMTFSVLTFSIFYSLLSYICIRKFIKITIPLLSIGKIVLSTIIAMSVLYVLDSINSGLLWATISSLAGLIVYLVSLISTKFLERTDINLLKGLTSKLPFLKNYLNVIVEFLYKFV